MNDGIVLHDIPPQNAGTDSLTEGLTNDPRSIEDNGDRVSSNPNDSSLPAVDGGRDAWLFLAACFVVEALVWGKNPDKPFLVSQQNSTHTSKVSPSPTASFRNTTPSMIHSKGPATSLS